MIWGGEVEGIEWLQSFLLNWIVNIFEEKNVYMLYIFFLLQDTFPNNQEFSAVNKYQLCRMF